MIASQSLNLRNTFKPWGESLCTEKYKLEATEEDTSK